MAQRSSKKTKTKNSKQRRTTKKHAKSLSAKRMLLATAVLDDPALPNLNKIKHIVVLMLENRSFDHMLGYQPRATGQRTFS
jgi:phospholipase C